jgi:hypothetical protein
MKAIGNARANAIFEHTMFPPWKKPPPTCDRATREKWIQAKYHQKLFLNPARPEQPEKDLYLAAKANDVISILSLIAYGVNVEHLHDHDHCRSALHIAVISGSLLAAELLLLNRANVNTKDSTGSSPLHYVCTIGNIGDLIQY